MINDFPLVKVKWLDAQTGFAALMPISEFKRLQTILQLFIWIFI